MVRNNCIDLRELIFQEVHTYSMWQRGAAVTGVDYSKDAVDIAVSTFGENNSGLRYLKDDVFALEDFKSYNKYVMADVVEHIEQDMLECLFKKISIAMEFDYNGRKILVIHTAPNRDYYEEYYPIQRQKAFECHTWIPIEPRSYYEQRMHINEQTPDGLEETLKRYFPCVRVWTGSITEYDVRKSHEERIKDNNIFALASVSQMALDEIWQSLDSLKKMPEKEKISAKIKILENLELDKDSSGRSIIELGRAKKTCKIEIELLNDGSVFLSSLRKYQNNISYHIQSLTGEMVIYDGIRTNIPGVLYPGERMCLKVEIGCLEKLLIDCDYILTFALVTEGVFWSDNYDDGSATIVIKMR